MGLGYGTGGRNTQEELSLVFRLPRPRRVVRAAETGRPLRERLSGQRDPLATRLEMEHPTRMGRRLRQGHLSTRLVSRTRKGVEL